MRILLVVTGLGVGGAERLLVELADRFVALGHDVVLARLHGEAELRPADQHVRLVNLVMQRNPASVLAATWRLRKLVREFKPDVINSHLVHANLICRLLRLITPIPKLISSAHNTNEEGYGRMLWYRLTDWLTDISTNVSEDAVKVFERQGALQPGRMAVVHNGVNTETFSFNESARSVVRSELSLDDSTPLLIAVGRLWQAKDYPNLLHAFAAVKYSKASPQLAVVGDGPLHEELTTLAKFLKIEERVRFLGVRHDVVDLLSAADLFVLSSAWEGMPMVIVEAMACGLVPVATDCGGVHRVIGDAGFLVPPHDSSALTTAIEKALKLEGKEKENLEQNARRRVVEHFSLDATAEHYLQIYRGSGVKSETRGPA